MTRLSLSCSWMELFFLQSVLSFHSLPKTMQMYRVFRTTSSCQWHICAIHFSLQKSFLVFLENLSLHCRFPRQVIWSEASLQERDLQCRELRYLWHILSFLQRLHHGLSIKRKTCKKRTGNSHSKYSEERTVSAPKLRFLLRTCASLLAAPHLSFLWTYCWNYHLLGR